MWIKLLFKFQFINLFYYMDVPSQFNPIVKY